MKLEDAKVLAEKICEVLQPFCERAEVAGSIRREKPEVNDIDVVALPKAVDLPGGLCGIVKVDPSTVWKNLIPGALIKIGFDIEASGPELLRFAFHLNGFQLDLYRARPGTWGVILLVRTGSKEHNVKLCGLAKSKGYKLSAAHGVLDCYGEVIAASTEEAIFKSLGLAFVEPKDREVT
jgi:DNA polymerase (family 10)